MSIDKNMNASSGFGGDADVSATGINKDEDISNGFSNDTASEIDGNTRKQLKVSKSKVFIGVMNCKRSHWSEKIPATKPS